MPCGRFAWWNFRLRVVSSGVVPRDWPGGVLPSVVWRWAERATRSASAVVKSSAKSSVASRIGASDRLQSAWFSTLRVLVGEAVCDISPRHRRAASGLWLRAHGVFSDAICSIAISCARILTDIFCAFFKVPRASSRGPGLGVCFPLVCLVP